MRPCRSTCRHPDKTPSFLVMRQTAHYSPTPVFCHCQFSRSRIHASKFRATLPHLTTLPVGCTRLGDPAASREMCLRVSPCFRIFPTSSFFSTCCSCCSCYCRGVQTASSRATTIPFRHARRGCRRSYSRRRASALVVLASLRSFAFTIGKFRRW